MRQEDKSDIYLKYEARVVSEVAEVKGEIKNVIVFEILYEYFVNGFPKEELIERYTPPGGSPTYVARILSTNQGVDTCRRPAVRNIFGHFMEAIGLKNPFQKYTTPHSKRRKKPSQPVLGDWAQWH